MLSSFCASLHTDINCKNVMRGLYLFRVESVRAIRTRSFGGLTFPPALRQLKFAKDMGGLQGLGRLSESSRTWYTVNT